MSPRSLPDGALSVFPTEDLLRAVLESTPVGTVLLQPIFGADQQVPVDFTLVYLNPEARRQLQLPERPACTYVHPELAAGSLAGLQAAFQAAAPVPLVFWSYLEGTARPFPGTGQRVGGGLLVTLAAEPLPAARSEQLASLNSVLATLQEFVFLFDLQGRFRYANQPLLDLWGLPLERVIGKSFFELEYPPELAQRFHAQVLHVVETGQAVMDETEYTNQAGEVGYYEYTFAPLLDAHGELEAVAGRAQAVTQSHQAQAALRASESKYQMLFESIDEGFCLIEVLFDDAGQPHDYRFLEVNRAFERQTGLSDAAGRRVRELIPGLEQHWFDFYGRVASSGQPLRFEERADQLHRRFDVYAFRIGEPGENSGGALQRHYPAPAGRGSPARKRGAVSALGRYAAAYHLDNESRRASRVFQPGVDPLHRPALRADYRCRNGRHGRAPRRWRPDAAAGRGLEEAARTKQRFEVEHRIRSASGEYRWFLVPAAPYHDPQTGETTRWFGSSVDIHDRKSAEEALRRSEEQFRLFVTASSDRVYRMSADWRQMFTLTGKGFLAETQHPTPDWWQTYIPAEDIPLVQAATTHATETKSVFELEHRVIQADGALGWAFSRAIPVLNEQGALTEWLGAVSDVTARKHVEQQLRAFNEQLQRVNADLDTFIYAASHDLKAPITNIEGRLTTLADELPAAQRPGEVNTIMALMQDSVERFKRTIEHLTDLSKLQKEHDRPAGEVALAPVVADVRQDLQPLVQQTGAQILMDVADCPNISLAAKNLRSVVYNVLSNALKYRHPDRTPQVRSSCHTKGEFVVLAVQDNGLGIASGRHDDLFQMFRRFHTHVEGSGVGLYMVKRIVENAGGRITLQSQPDQGSTFAVWLPRH